MVNVNGQILFCHILLLAIGKYPFYKKVWIKITQPVISNNELCSIKEAMLNLPVLQEQRKHHKFLAFPNELG